MTRVKMVSGDQHPLNGGLLRAFFFHRRGEHIEYFRHDADGQSEWAKIEKKIRATYFWWFGKRLVSLSGKNLPFTLFGLPVAFAPNVDAEEVRTAGAGITTIQQYLSELGMVFPRRFDIVSKNEGELKGNVNNLNSGILVLIAYFKYLRWMFLVAGTIKPTQRLGIYIRVVVTFLVVLLWFLIPGLSLTRLMWWLGQLALGRPLPSRMKQSSLRNVMRDSGKIKEFWAKDMKSKAAKDGSIPFFALNGIPGFWSRGFISSRQELDEARFIIPKATVLYIWLRSRSVMAHGGIGYGGDAAGEAASLGIRLQLEQRLVLYPGRTLEDMGIVPNVDLLTALYGKYYAMDTKFKEVFVATVAKKTIEAWLKDENLDVLSLWILGGWTAIYRTLNSAR